MSVNVCIGFDDSTLVICPIVEFTSNSRVVNIGLFKVNLEFSFSFAGFSFSGLDPNIYSGFKP